MTIFQIERTVSFGRRGRGARQVLRSPSEQSPAAVSGGRVPRVARLLALAHRFDRLLQSGAVINSSALARLGHVSRARIAQIFNLLNLSPTIQEEILFLPRTERGRDAIHLAHLLSIALTQDWKRQHRLWRRLRAATLEPAQRSASPTGDGRTG